MEKILLIIPAYNEEKNILNVYQDIQNYNKKNKTHYDVIVINDGSTDHTKMILEENKIPHINLICNLGIGGAVQTGYRYAYQNQYDIAIQYDGDGQHEVSYVKDIIAPIVNENMNMVIGSRFIKHNQEGFQSTFSRRIGIHIISFLIRFKTGKKIYDTTSGFRAVDRKIIKRFAHNYPVEYPEPITTTELLKSSYEVKEVPVQMKERTGGKSSIHSWKQAYYMLNVALSILLVGRDK